MTNRKFTGRVATLLAAAFCLSALSAVAMGTSGATIQAFDIGRSDSTIYAAAEGGIFKWPSGGSSWSEASTGLADRHMISVAVSPGNSNVAYASPWTGGIYKTLNGGQLWFKTSFADQHSGAYILVDPTDANTVYANTCGGGVFKSANAGATWALAGLSGQ